MKCPNCGSTAQVRLANHETYVWRDTVSVYLVYQGGCGCRLASRIAASRKEEKFYGEIEKEG